MPEQNVQAAQWKPAKRTDRLILQAVGAEVLIYDEETHKACCLNDLAAAVWSACDGSRTTSTIASMVSVAGDRPIEEEVVLFTLAELRRDGLLLPDLIPEAIVLPSRREMVRKLGFGAAMMLPVVTSIMAPKAAQAYGSGGGVGCVDCSSAQPSQGQSVHSQGSRTVGAPTGFPQ